MKQSEMVAEMLKAAGFHTEIVRINSAGDLDRSSPLYSIGGSGVFVNEVNQKVLDGEVDLAVHSAKDLPSVLPGGIVISAVLPRESPMDALISNHSLRELPRGATIGTSSIRRIHELKLMRGDLSVKNLRGNLDTRIGKLRSGEYDGIIVAEAGLIRLGLDVQYERLDSGDFLPAPNQGIIAVVSRKGSDITSALGKLSDSETMEIMRLERKLVNLLGLGCSLPAAVFCERAGSGYRIRTRFYSSAMREYKEFTRSFSDESAVVELADEIRRKVPHSYGFSFKGD